MSDKPGTVCCDKLTVSHSKFSLFNKILEYLTVANYKKMCSHPLLSSTYRIVKFCTVHDAQYFSPRVKSEVNTLPNCILFLGVNSTMEN